MERKWTGVWIPKELWLDRNLSVIEKVMLVEIGAYCSDGSTCFASNAYFADFFDLSKARVSEIISSLAEKGYIDVVLEREGVLVARRHLSIATPSENRTTPLRKTEYPPSEKAECINTNSTNTKSKSISPYKPPKGGRISTAQTPGTEVYSQRFEDVWKSWVKGKGGSKADAYKAWLKRNLDHPDHSHVAVMILHDVQTRATSHRQWLEGFPPHMSTYLNKSGWTADIDTSTGTRTNGRAKTSYEQVMEASERNRAALREDYDNLSPDEQRDFRAAFGH